LWSNFLKVRFFELLDIMPKEIKEGL